IRPHPRPRPPGEGAWNRPAARAPTCYAHASSPIVQRGDGYAIIGQQRCQWFVETRGDPMADNPTPDPNEALSRIVASAQRLGVELDEADALQWLTAMAARDADQDVVV